jgi:hypothetical protein
MYKAAGAKMPATYNSSIVVKVPLDARFNKNTTVNSKGETVISIGAENNVAGENISDTTSHSLQGVLDRAKATFPFELKLVPEAMDVYGYLTRAGVDQEQIVYLLNQPLVAQYLDLQKINESSINNTLFGKKQKYMIGQELFIENLKKTLSEAQLKKLVLDINKNKLAATLKSLPEDLEVLVSIPGKGDTYTVAALRKELNAFAKTGEGLNPNSISAISIGMPDQEGGVTRKEIYSYVVPNFDKAGFLLNKENAYFLIDYIAKNTLANKDIIQTSDLEDVMKKQDSSSLKALMIFAHYIELERQYSRMNDLEKSFTPDKANLATAQEAIIRKKKYKTFFSPKQTNVPEYLKQSEEIDQDFLNKLMNESVVSSLIFDDLTIDLLKPLFPTKLDDAIVNYIENAIKENRGEISNAFGVGADGRAQFIRQYGNTLVNFIYQNYLSYSSDATGKLTNYPEAVDGKEIVVDNTMDVLVKIEEDRILINTRIIEFDFANKSFLENNATDAAYADRDYDTFKVGQDPFKNLRSFYKYHIELALLEENNPIDTLVDSDYFGQMVARNDGNVTQAYIQYISERALINSYNPYYIMGRTKYSYTNNLLELIDSLENYPALFDRFPILTQISNQRNKEGYRIIRLNDRSEVKGALAQDYYNQIRQLGDISIQKLDNPSNNPVIASKDKRISEIFNLFSIMMYYQHGVGKSGTSFNSALDSSQFKDIIMPATQAFMGNYINPSKVSGEEIQALLNAVYQQTVSRQRFKIMLGTKNIYENADIEAIANELEKKRKDGEIEEFDEDEGSQKVPAEFKRGDKIILDEDVKKFKKYLISSNGVKPNKFTTPETKFPAFYNGRQQGMPNTAAWMLNDSNLYDMVEISQDSDLLGTVYYENVDLETGYQMIKEGEGPTQPGVNTDLQVISPDYGVVQAETNPSKEFDQQLANAIFEDVRDNAYVENGSNTAQRMWGNGLMWKGNNTKKPTGIPLKVIPAKVDNNANGKLTTVNTPYFYDPLYNDGTPVAPITNLDFLKKHIENTLGIDMSDYDVSLNNIYEEGHNLYRHTDIDESNTAKGYPVIVYVFGNDHKVRFDDNGGKRAFGQMVNPKTLTLKNGDIYAFGMGGKGRFETVHDVVASPKTNNNFPELTGADGTPTKNYTVTLTFRRAADLTPGMPTTPAKISTQPTGTPVADKFAKKNIFTVTPQEGVIDTKAKVKASIATQYIGFGEGIVGKDGKKSSTQIYREQVGALANTGNYSSDDVIFVSIPGLRGDAAIAKREQDKTIKEAIKAVEAGATILTDNESYIESSKYNTGEKRLYKNMESKGYKYSEIVIDGQVIGAWSKPTSTEPAGPIKDEETPIDLQIKILEIEIKELKEMDDMAELVNINVIIAKNMKKITPESARRETGAKAGTNKDINIGLLDKNGVSVERAAETIWMDYFAEDQTGYSLATIEPQEIRNIIIDILTMGKNNFLKQYLNTEKIAQKEIELRELKEIQKNKGAGKDMSNTSLVTDMEEYDRLVTASNGVQPKTFTVGTRTWTLNKFGNYDWSDPTTNEIYMRNINMENGVSVPEPGMNDPVDPALVEESLSFINSNRKLLALDHKLADMGIDINDFLKQVEQIKTMEDYFKAKKTIDKLCQ